MNDAPTTTPGIRSKLALFASPSVLFYAIPWLMVLLVLGTIAQKNLGIYTAQKTYFSSWILWMGFIPLPGAYLTLGSISLCLLVKFLFFSPWQAQKTGIIIAHLGVLILMIGGVLTATTQHEGFIMLKEGDETSLVSDYHNRALTIKKNDTILKTIDFDKIQTDQAFPAQSLPFKIDVLKTCKNCRPTMTNHAEGKKGFAQKVELATIPEDKDSEGNLSGFTFNVTGTQKNQDGIYIAVEEIPLYPEIAEGHANYTFVMGRKKTTLPFSIRLNKFEKQFHPGTDMAKSYSSFVTITKDGAQWDATIKMNEPLRYKGYTFYQSSFSIRPDGEFSILSVVQNKGRIFPYLASFIIFFGLLSHLIIKSMARKNQA